MRKNAALSFVLLCAVAMSSVQVAFARLDEGMYMPDKIAGIAGLKKRGLKISPQEIYNPAGGGLSEAVIRLSIGCTAEFVSPEDSALPDLAVVYETEATPGADKGAKPSADAPVATAAASPVSSPAGS